MTASRRQFSVLIACVAHAFSAPLLARAAPEGLEQLRISTSLSHQRSDAERGEPLLVHFHGAADVTEANFRRAGLSGVLITINCHGLSSAYRRPFENSELFPYVVDSVRNDLTRKRRLPEDVEWSRIDVSCFSAGYGAVRELLRQPASSRRIDAVVAADSIYASIHLQGERRVVDAEQMAPFVTFAKQAVQGQKMFLVTHSQLAVEAYASTVETADLLLRETGLTRRDLAPQASSRFAPLSRASAGRFTLLGYPGDDGESHMAHLKQIGELWKELQADRPPRGMGKMPRASSPGVLSSPRQIGGCSAGRRQKRLNRFHE